MSKEYNLFISHSWSYSDSYNKLVELLNNKPYFFYRNYSVPKDDPIHNAPTSKKLYDAIRNQMWNCHVVLILAGVYATYSTWINNEIQIAQKEFSSPKPIVGIKPWGNTIVSSVVSEASEEIINWNTESIVAAIRKYSI